MNLTVPGEQPTDRAAINRANSQHSTGPRTEAGKQRSSLNALRHGLTGQTIVLPADDLIAYERHCKGFFLEYQPKAATETFLVQTIADTTWRLYRIAGLENNLLTLGITEHEASVDTDHPQVLTGLAMAKTYREQCHVLASLGLHQHRLARLFDKTLKQLREIQSARAKMQPSSWNRTKTQDFHTPRRRWLRFFNRRNRDPHPQPQVPSPQPRAPWDIM